ncbi:hypothetical protein ACFOM8_17730 [Paracoccus angustae]|uniref:Uncharacterized protein n=1 Tax=Paracoccus angustae TaxID=1671480 RepID=A0ABV7U8H0_9RHOB
MSADGRQARDVMLGLMKTCQKLGISFFAYLGDRLGLSGTGERVPTLPDLVGAQPAKLTLPRNLPQLPSPRGRAVRPDAY